MDFTFQPSQISNDVIISEWKCEDKFNWTKASGEGLDYPSDGKLRCHQDAPHRWDALLGNSDFQSCHGATLVELKNGDLLTAFYAGEYEGSDGVAIFTSKLLYGESVWSRPSMVAQKDGRSLQNPVLHVLPSGKVVLLFTSQAAFRGQADADVNRMESVNEGETWSSPTVIIPTGSGAFIRNRLVESHVTPGRLYLPMYFTPDGEFTHNRQYATVLKSDDEGRTFSDHSGPLPGSDNAYATQPSLIYVKSKNDSKEFMRAFFRSRKKDFVRTSESYDDGVTFTEAIPAYNGKLPNNDCSVQAIGEGVTVYLALNNRNGPLRYPLSITLSYDGGESFLFVRDIIPHPASKSIDTSTYSGEFSYPSILRSKVDGFVHIVYTHKRISMAHTKLHPEWFSVNSP